MKVTANLSVEKNNPLPALSEHTTLRYFNFIALYIAQGIPEGMAFFGIPAWMAMNGKTPGEIGSFVAAIGLPWSFKIVVAPLMDRFSFLPMGRRRPWIIFGQLGLMASFIAMAFVPDPLNNLNLFMASAFAVGFFGSVQDVATDGLAIDIVPIDQQAKANGFMWGAKIAGTSASLALGSWLLHKYSFTASILMLASFVCLIMLVPLFLRERPGEKLLPWTKGAASEEAQQMQLGSWSIILKSLYSVFHLRNSLLLALLGFIILGSFNYLATLLPIFTVKALGWTDLAYSQFFATATLIGGLAGMFIGGILIDRFGKVRMMTAYFIVLIILTSALVFFKSYWVNNWFISGFMIIEQALYVFASIGMFAMAMQCCWKKVSASQFTLYMTIANLGRIVGAYLIGPFKNMFSWEYTLFAFAIMMLCALLVVRSIRIDSHVERVKDLEKKDLESQLAVVVG